MEKKLALLGAARPNYHEKIRNITSKCGHCWSEWTYKIEPSKKKILDKQDSFCIYIHDIEDPKDKSRGTGTGQVKYKLLVEKNNYKYTDEPSESPEPKCTPPTNRDHRLYAKTTNPIQIDGRKWNTFKDYDLGTTFSELNKRFPPFSVNPNIDFLYIIDEDI